MNDTDQHIRKGVAVVTGAGSGLGRALALELCRAGMTVVGFGRTLAPLQETALAAKSGSFIAMQVDVAKPAKVKAAFERIAAEFGPVTLLINNAAVYPKQDFLANTPEGFMKSVNINLGGVVAASHAALDQMSKTGIGRILNVSTFADIAPISGSSAYAVSKGAAQIFTRALVADIGDRLPDIVVSDWMPGMLATQMGIADGLQPEVAAKWGAKLALWHDPTLTGTIFEMDREILPPRCLKRRLLDKALLRRPPKPRHL